MISDVIFIYVLFMCLERNTESRTYYDSNLDKNSVEANCKKLSFLTQKSY